MTKLDNWILRKLGGGKHRGRPIRTNPPRPPAPRRPPIALHPSHDQLQSPLLYSGFPAELRILVYEAVLGDPTRLMHIVPYDDMSKRVGHCRCKDMDSPYPTWQHTCFGIWHDKVRGGKAYLVPPFSNDNLLALLLSCRLVYFETIDILYTANTFSFKGGGGILALKSIMPATNWQRLRHLSVSTSFLAPLSNWIYDQGYPPENLTSWSEGCLALRGLESLHLLRFDIIIRASGDADNPAAVDLDSLVSVLKPMKDLKALVFEVEMTFNIPEAALLMIGERNFTLLVKKRQYNSGLFAT